jgi:uncharacterized protein (UPF0128 family)
MVQLNEQLKEENEQLKAKLALNAREYADEELRAENAYLRAQLANAQSKMPRTPEVMLISAKVRKRTLLVMIRHWRNIYTTHAISSDTLLISTKQRGGYHRDRRPRLDFID